MSATDRRHREQARSGSEVDLSDLGTISAEELEVRRVDAELQAEGRTALEAMAALERDGRLIVD